MPRRKKKVKETSEVQNLEKKDVETTSPVNVKRKRKLEDAFIVISDSDGEEPKEENGLQKTKTEQSNRAKCLAKRKIAQMTEEEQFALALKMSEQEAREVNSQEEEEEELLRKAIAESLNVFSPWLKRDIVVGFWKELPLPRNQKGQDKSCRPSDASATRSRPLSTGPSSQSHQEKTTDSGTTEGTWQLVPPSLFKGSYISQGNEAEEREEPWDHTENTEEEPVSGSSGSWDQSSQPVFENENVKCFDRCTGHLAEHTQCGKPQNECGQGDQASEKNEGISEDMGDEDKEEERQESRASVWHSKIKDFQESPIKSLKEKLLLEEEPTTSHGQSSQRLFVEETSEEGNSVPVSQSITALTNKRSSVLMTEDSAEEITVCPETQLSSPETFDLEREVSPGSRETPDEVRIIMADEVGNREDTEKEIRTSAFSASTKVSCPLCDQGFPLTKIEQHAMYCNGLMEQETVLTRRQKEAKSKSDCGIAVQTSLNIDKNEKCYLCKSLVPFKEYQCHVESCLQLARGDQGDRPEESGRVCSDVEGKLQQWPKNAKEKGRSEGRLLSLLEQSEHKTADAEIKTRSSETVAFGVPSPGKEEAGCSRQMQSSLTHLELNESPIKSFVSISEATDCLVDFKKQFTVQPGSRTRTKAGRGRRRKS
ncbi:BRCA1-A complex subunit RAP80 isoform X4 [Rousettus aegyptiacus]|uniref:BRCA1-A complex subunit RAP80 isoform X4 n=1 Tax=Rousettus aegyptiacus TaxID=9407 RepID=UPI00168D97C6|nr:BRCA1-A complex subunit RAP80 isoform X4 [Rousettus aegyptiacus]